MKEETEAPPLYDHDFVTFLVLFTKSENEDQYEKELELYNMEMQDWEDKDPDLQKIQVDLKPVPPKLKVVNTYQEAVFNIGDMIISYFHKDVGEDNEDVVKVYYFSRTFAQPQSMVILGKVEDFIHTIKKHGARIQ